MFTDGVRKNKGKGRDGMEPNLLHAAEYNDFDEALRAINNDALLVREVKINGLNAIHLSLLNYHEDKTLFLMNHAKVSTTTKDYFGRDALEYALKHSNPELCEKVYERWLQEKAVNNVASLNIT